MWSLISLKFCRLQLFYFSSCFKIKRVSVCQTIFVSLYFWCNFQLGLFFAWPCPISCIPLGGRWPARNHRPRMQTVFWFSPVEWKRPYSEREALWLDRNGRSDEHNVLLFVNASFTICYEKLVIDQQRNLSSSLGEAGGMLNGKSDLDPLKGSNWGVAKIVLDP